MTERVGDAMCQHVDFIHSCHEGAHYAPESFPALFRYTFPEYRFTNRRKGGGSPYMDTQEANFIFIHGLCFDLESRYPPDADCLRAGRRPTDADYAMTPTPPDVVMMRDEPIEEYQRYVCELNRIREEHPVLIRGRYRDTEGFEIRNPRLTAAGYVLGDEMAVVVWNETDSDQAYRLKVDGYEKVDEIRPGGGGADRGPALSAGDLAVLFFRKVGTKRGGRKA
jgi:hypothetical protein